MWCISKEILSHNEKWPWDILAWNNLWYVVLSYLMPLFHAISKQNCKNVAKFHKLSIVIKNLLLISTTHLKVAPVSNRKQLETEIRNQSHMSHVPHVGGNGTTLSFCSMDQLSCGDAVVSNHDQSFTTPPDICHGGLQTRRHLRAGQWRGRSGMVITLVWLRLSNREKNIFGFTVER